MQEQHGAKLGLESQVHHSTSHLKENSDCLVTALEHYRYKVPAKPLAQLYSTSKK